MTELQNQIEEMLGPAVQVNDEVIRTCQDKNEGDVPLDTRNHLC